MKVEIQKAQNSDIEILSKLATDSFVNAYKSTLSEKLLLQYSQAAFSKSTIKEIIENNTTVYLIAKNKEDIVGYIHLEPLSSPSFVSSGKSPMEMIRLYTKVGYEGRGIGSHLLNEAILLSKQVGHDYMWLQVWEGNSKAQRFYKSFGFESLGVQPYEAKCLSRPVVIMGQAIDVLFNR